LFGNILLYDFDCSLNGRGIVCVRFIDDFVLLGVREGAVDKAFQKAKLDLQALGLVCHDPTSGAIDRDKASRGRAEDGFVFLGYDLRPGLFQPSRQARLKLEKTIDGHLYLGRKAISDVKRANYSFECRQRYAQTLALVDKVIRGWGEAFAYANAPSTVDGLDRRIDDQLNDFRVWFARQVNGQDWKTKRRLGGVGLLGDVRPKSLDDVPFLLPSTGRFVRTSNSITISTDGSLAAQVRRKGKDQGPGGWAFVVHETGEERGGYATCTTNNQMELRAVIEAIRYVDPKKSVIIRTDSQYVCDAINRQNVIKSNSAMWNEYRKVTELRRIKVVWIKGHAGDPQNERADQLAVQQANLAKDILSSNSVAA
jgi:RNA-directed DNA polymerase